MFIDNLEDELNISETENGAKGYKTTKHEIVDFNFKVSSYRSLNDEDIKLDFERVWIEDKQLVHQFAN